MSNSKKSDNLRFAIFFIGAKSGQHFLQSFRVLCAMFRSISLVVEANFLVFDLSCAIFAIEDGERVDVAVGQKKKRRPLCQVNLKVNDAVAERIRWLWFLGYGVQIGGKYCTSTSIFSCAALSARAAASPRSPPLPAAFKKFTRVLVAVTGGWNYHKSEKTFSTNTVRERQI